MCLFLEVHELDGRDAEAFVQARSAQAPRGFRLLEHWLGDGDGGGEVALLVEVPNEATLRASAGGATEITGLFAPIERWMSYDSIEIA